MFILKRLEVYRAFGFERIDKILRMRTSHSSVECLPTSRVKAFLIITVDEKALNVHTLYTYTPARKAAGNRIAVFFCFVTTVDENPGPVCHTLQKINE